MFIYIFYRDPQGNFTGFTAHMFLLSHKTRYEIFHYWFHVEAPNISNFEMFYIWILRMPIM